MVPNLLKCFFFFAVCYEEGSFSICRKLVVRGGSHWLGMMEIVVNKRIKKQKERLVNLVTQKEKPLVSIPLIL